MCPTGTGSSPPLSQTKNDSNLHSAFHLLDVDHDGKISREDLRAFYPGFSSSTGIRMSSDEDVIGSMMLAADSNKDGYVEYNEFEKILKSTNLGKAKKNSGRFGFGLMQDVFREMDKDGDGKVGQEDLKSYLRWAGFDANDDDVKAMIEFGGGHESGGVTFEGLLKILALSN